MPLRLTEAPQREQQGREDDGEKGRKYEGKPFNLQYAENHKTRETKIDKGCSKKRRNIQQESVYAACPNRQH